MVASWRRKKLTLYCLNLPAMISIPAFIEFADLETIYAERAETVMLALSCIDMVFFVKSYILYQFLQKLVTKITYDSESDKLIFRQEFGSELLNVKETEYEPKEIEKYRAKTFNKSVGYRSIKKGEHHRRLATEIPGALWYDRKFLESVVSQPGERIKSMKRMEKWHDKKKRKSNLVE